MSGDRIGGTQEALLIAIQTRLVEKVPRLNEQNCFVCDLEIPDDRIIGIGDIFCTVCPGDGVFPDSFFAGGGTATLNEQSVVKVTILRRAKIDHPLEVKNAWFDAQKGLVSQFKPSILRALLIDERNGIKFPWDPRSNGGPMLRDQLAPGSCSAPRQVSGIDFVGFTMIFKTSFDWQI